MTEIQQKTGNFLRDNRGVGAIEFAFIAPIMVLLYFGAVEITVALSVDTKVSRAGNLTLDLVTQSQNVSRNDLNAMVDMASSVLAPYTDDNIDLRFTGIQVNAAGTAQITWSWGNVIQRPYVVGSNPNIPANLLIPNAFYVRGEIVNKHNFLRSFPIMGRDVASLNLNETYYMRPRLGSNVNCSNC